MCCERWDRFPGGKFAKVTRRHIENAPGEREYGYFTSIDTPTCHELQFKLLLFRALTDQPLHKGGEMREQQQHFKTRTASGTGCLKTQTDACVLGVAKRLFRTRVRSQF